MKRLFILTACLLALLPSLGLAQTTTPRSLLDSTTLSGAIDANQTTLVLASATASTGSSFGAPAAGDCLLIDNELMRITAMASTTATVTRGNTARGPHANAAIILIGDCSQSNGGFQNQDPPNVGGNQTCSAFNLPWVNMRSGDSWWCDQSSNIWTVTNLTARNGTAGSRRVTQ